jgi:hypothetical protein
MYPRAIGLGFQGFGTGTQYRVGASKGVLNGPKSIGQSSLFNGAATVSAVHFIAAVARRAHRGVRRAGCEDAESGAAHPAGHAPERRGSIICGTDLAAGRISRV